ncbi:MAG TPA: electron transfer flavoprotein subunit alpha/FixB family protein [Candidatus Dormibacteraeota bacterium]|nr:electron transfer flavoprotein subunit alpha/FixB family protein [Candidatus Dormibacteraeota bacterium]
MSGGRAAVVAWIEDDREVVADAEDLAGALGGPLWVVAAGGDPAALAACGADRVLLLDAPYDPEVHTDAIASCLAGAPRAYLLPGDAHGSELAPRLAARLGAACLLDCAWVRPAGPGLAAARWAHDDRALERWEVPAGLPLVATLRPGERGSAGRRGPPADVSRLPAPERPARARRLRRLVPDARSVRLARAERVVAAGLGIGSPDLLPAIQEMADLLGAALGASRPLADRGWVPFDRQIGTTGQSVSPRLYLAIGISGAAQHLAGVRGAETVVAVNTDPACPMMARATLAAVGDAGDVVRALGARLRQVRQAAWAP